MRLTLTMIGAAWLLAAPALAEQSYPDLKGTWVGTDTGAFVTAPEFGTKAVADEVEIKLVVDKQNGQHLSGSLSSDQRPQPFSGVIKSNGDILMSQPSGMVEARLLGEDILEACYVRIGAFSQMATCSELKRRK